jgi:hypothetical protein
MGCCNLMDYLPTTYLPSKHSSSHDFFLSLSSRHRLLDDTKCCSTQRSAVCSNKRTTARPNRCIPILQYSYIPRAASKSAKSELQLELCHRAVYQIDYTRVVQWSVLGCDQLDSFLSCQTSEKSGCSWQSREASTHTDGQLRLQT